MPLPLLPIIAGGMALGGTALSLMPGKDLPNVNPDPSGRALDFFEDLRNPMRMLPVFQRLAASLTPSADTFLTTSAATGGSPVIAREQFERAQQRAGVVATNAFDQYRTNADRTAAGVLGQHFQNQQFQQQARLDDYFGRQGTRRALGAGLANLGGTLFGQIYGAGRGMPTTGATRLPNGTPVSNTDFQLG